MHQSKVNKLLTITLLLVSITIILFSSNSRQQVTVKIDSSILGNKINKDIFGVNYADATHFGAVKYTVNRKGGNSDTRFNWEQNIHNTAQDWFYMNIADDIESGQLLPNGSTATVFVDTSNKYQSKSMLTASLIGYTPLDERVKKWSFSVAKYGSQTQTECTSTGYASWCMADAGNAKLTDTTYITGNSPSDTSKIIDENYVRNWIKFMKNRGTPVKLWSLDNEMDLWHGTHRDVHPNPVTYDEIWTLTQKYAAAIKTEDSTISTFGPASWGHCGYYYSPADGCYSAADRQAHSDMPLLEYYMSKVCEYKKNTGVLLVNYLDIHYYPQASGIYDPSQTSDTNAELRLRTVKSLYDYNYLDESWIPSAESNGPLSRIALIPRMKASIAKYCPEMKLAITEYNFGADNIWSSALAQVEILSVFGREGVDLATRFTVPIVGSMVEKSFKFFMNYDGNGANIDGTYVNTTTSNVDSVGAYSFVNTNSNTLYIVLVNKLTSSTSVSLQLAGSVGKGKSITTWTFASPGTISKSSQTLTTSATDGTVSVSLASRTANLLVVPSFVVNNNNNGNSPVIICYGISNTSATVCSGFGKCVANNTCVCDATHSGSKCENTISQPVTICYGISNTSATVCSGFGKCVANNTCVCDATHSGSKCENTIAPPVIICYGVLSTSQAVCSGNGKCLANNTCTCDAIHTGSKCENTITIICYGIVSTNTSVCSGFGSCVANNTCTCDSKHIGYKCEGIIGGNGTDSNSTRNANSNSSQTMALSPVLIMILCMIPFVLSLFHTSKF